MNPVTPRTPQPGRPIQDVAPPQANPADTASLTTTIVQDIPIRTQAGPANEDAELDKIIQDVGDLKKAAAKPKKGFFSKKPKAQAPVKPPAAPQPAAQPAAAAPPAPKPTDKSSAPVFVIFMTIIITSALIAAAFYSYRN